MKRHPLLIKPKPTKESRLKEVRAYINRCTCQVYREWLEQQEKILLEKKS